MKIDGLTTCVGEKYAHYLDNSLALWLGGLDSLTILTDSDTLLADSFKAPSRTCTIVKTDIFTRYGASFNKGAALSEGFARSRPTEWVLNFDADIIPPADWRSRLEQLVLQPEKLFGCSHRYREDGSLLPDAPFPNIWGFFHLWNVDSPYSWRRPVFDSTCGHAGNYDHTFMRQWPEDQRFDLWPSIKVIHQGEPRSQWFGRDPKNHKKMFNLFMLGLWEAWHTKAGHVTVPEPKEDLTFDARSLTVDQVREILKLYTDTDPFRYHLEIQPPCLNTVAVA